MRKAPPPGDTDHWFTPNVLYYPRNRKYRYTLDVAGHAESRVSQDIGLFFTILTNGLAHSWSGHKVWCNPPYSFIEPWVVKTHGEMTEGGCRLVDMLVPADRTEQPWWQNYVEPYRDGRGTLPGVTVRTHFPRARRKFGFPGDPTGRSGTTPKFGLVFITWERTAPL